MLFQLFHPLLVLVLGGLLSVVVVLTGILLVLFRRSLLQLHLVEFLVGLVVVILLLDLLLLTLLDLLGNDFVVPLVLLLGFLSSTKCTFFLFSYRLMMVKSSSLSFY